MAAITPRLTNSTRLRTRKLPWLNLAWPFSVRKFIEPPEPGNRITIACRFLGTLVRKKDWVTPVRVASVMISCADATASKTSNPRMIVKGFMVQRFFLSDNN